MSSYENIECFQTAPGERKMTDLHKSEAKQSIQTDNAGFTRVLTSSLTDFRQRRLLLVNDKQNTIDSKEIMQVIKKQFSGKITLLEMKNNNNNHKNITYLVR